MAKFTPPAILDKMADYIIANASREIVCSTQPTNYTEANATYALADVAVDSSDFTKANGDVSGRKVTVAAQSGVLIDASGSGQHIALVNDTGSELLYVTTVSPSQTLTANGTNTVNVPAWDIEVGGPT
jgi:hypothetical protein